MYTNQFLHLWWVLTSGIEHVAQPTCLLHSFQFVNSWREIAMSKVIPAHSRFSRTAVSVLVSVGFGIPCALLRHGAMIRIAKSF